MAEDGKRILIVTDAWYPQVNGVVRTLTHTRDQLQESGHDVIMLTPEHFTTFPAPPILKSGCPFPGSGVARLIREQSPEIIHIATEGPWLAARNFCKRHQLSFTTAYHTRFPEYVYSRIRIPLVLTYGYLRWFHGSGKSVLAPTPTVIRDLEQHRVGSPVQWPRGVDLELFSPPKRRTKTKNRSFSCGPCCG